MMTWKRVPRFSSLCISQLKLEGSPQLRREGEGTDTGSSRKSLLSPAMGEVGGGGRVWWGCPAGQSTWDFSYSMSGENQP